MLLFSFLQVLLKCLTMFILDCGHNPGGLHWYSFNLICRIRTYTYINSECRWTSCLKICQQYFCMILSCGNVDRYSHTVWGSLEWQKWDGVEGGDKACIRDQPWATSCFLWWWTSLWFKRILLVTCLQMVWFAVRAWCGRTERWGETE